MIDYLGASITDILPDSLKHGPEARAMGHAISRMLGRILGHSHKASVHAAIDSLPEEAVDLLAVELRSKYYGALLSLPEKREVVKKTLLWHYRAGTLHTVQELADFIFRDARVQEWFAYGAAPYLFRIWAKVVDQDISMEKFLQFVKSMYEVKNTRSHLEAVIFDYEAEGAAKTVAAPAFGYELRVEARLAEGIRADAGSHGAAAMAICHGIEIGPGRAQEGSGVYALSASGERQPATTADGTQVKTG